MTIYFPPCFQATMVFLLPASMVVEGEWRAFKRTIPPEGRLGAISWDLF
jgi:hypothetical protein